MILSTVIRQTVREQIWSSINIQSSTLVSFLELRSLLTVVPAVLPQVEGLPVAQLAAASCRRSKGAVAVLWARPNGRECRDCRNYCNYHVRGTKAQVQKQKDQHIKDMQDDVNHKA